MGARNIFLGSVSVSLKNIDGINITKTYLYNFDPLKPHFYIVKLGFTGVYIIFLISAQNIDCGYSLEPPRRGGSNEYPQLQKYEKYRRFLSENFQFLEMNFSIYLNRRVFVMDLVMMPYNRHCLQIYETMMLSFSCPWLKYVFNYFRCLVETLGLSSHVKCEKSLVRWHMTLSKTVQWN